MAATTMISTLTPIPTPTAPIAAVPAITAIIVKTITITIQINSTKPNHANYKIIKQKIYERKKQKKSTYNKNTDSNILNDHNYEKNNINQ
jgi:hypothetical protein